MNFDDKNNNNYCSIKEYKDKNNNIKTCTIKDMDELTQKFGYMEIKQSSDVRGRKLKKWRRRWVVFTKMSDLSSNEIVGKLDLYENEDKWQMDPSSKTTFILEHVTSVRMAKSRTHPHAFEVVDRQPNIVLSGTTELESYSWLLTLQQIFTPHMVETNKNAYLVTVLPTPDSTKWKLDGEYSLVVSDNGVCLVEQRDVKGHVKVCWGLSTLIRFKMENDPEKNLLRILVITCGPNSPTGESSFKFISDEAKDIIKTIRFYICIALAHKQNARRGVNKRIRSISATYSENNFMTMLDNQPVLRDSSRDRSDSESSSSLPPTSPCSVGSPITTEAVTARGSENSFRMAYRKSLSELGVVDEVDEHSSSSKSVLCEPFEGCKQQVVEDVCERDSGCILGVSLEMPESPKILLKVPHVAKGDPGYSVIKDVAPNVRTSAESSKADPPEMHSAARPTDRILAKVSEELILPASLVAVHPGYDKLPGFDREVNRPTLIDASWPSSRSLEGKGKSDSEPIYHELDRRGREKERCRTDGNLSLSPGPLNRRRSSSTGDLLAFWKKLGLDSGLENVYDELDEHRRSFFARSEPKRKEVPPALPARPLTINFSTAPKDNDNQPVMRLKKSIAGRGHSGKRKTASPELGVEKSKAKTCKCAFPHPRKRSFNSKRSTCDRCGCKIKDNGSPKYVEKNQRNRSSSYNEVPSDITTEQHRFVKGSTKDNPTEEDIENDSYSTIKTSRKQEEGILIDFNDNATSKSRRSSETGSNTQVTRPDSIHNPLIGFFLDDEKFEKNPLVTGELMGKSNADLLVAINEDSQNADHLLTTSAHQASQLPPPIAQSLCFCPETPSPTMRSRSTSADPPIPWLFSNNDSPSSMWDPWSPVLTNPSPFQTPTSPSNNFCSNQISQTNHNGSVSSSHAPFQCEPFQRRSTLSTNTSLDSEVCYMNMTNRNGHINSTDLVTNSVSPNEPSSHLLFDPFSNLHSFDMLANTVSPSPTDTHSLFDPLSYKPSNKWQNLTVGIETITSDSSERQATVNDNIYVRPGRTDS